MDRTGVRERAQGREREREKQCVRVVCCREREIEGERTREVGGGKMNLYF